jgi:hypothetical protein
MCIAIMNSSMHIARKKIHFIYFCPIIRWPKRCGSSLPYRHRTARRLPKIYSIISADFRLVVASAHLAEAIEIQGPIALSIFFSTLKSPPITTHKRPPHTFLPGRVSYQTPPLPTTPSFCSLLCRPNERWPSKTGAPPISHFFDGRHFGAPNKRICSSARKPGRQAPVLDS